MRRYHQAQGWLRPTIQTAAPRDSAAAWHELDGQNREAAFTHMDETGVNCEPGVRYDADTLRVLQYGA
jgi:hypothetical protein